MILVMRYRILGGALLMKFILTEIRGTTVIRRGEICLSSETIRARLPWKESDWISRLQFLEQGYSLCSCNSPLPRAVSPQSWQTVEKYSRDWGVFFAIIIGWEVQSWSRGLLQWTDPQQLHGIGQYAADAYYIFCRGKWKRRPPPQDKDLLLYYNFLVETGGEGSGFEREQFTANPQTPTKLVKAWQYWTKSLL